MIYFTNSLWNDVLWIVLSIYNMENTLSDYTSVKTAAETWQGFHQYFIDRLPLTLRTSCTKPLMVTVTAYNGLWQPKFWYCFQNDWIWKQLYLSLKEIISKKFLERIIKIPKLVQISYTIRVLKDPTKQDIFYFLPIKNNMVQKSPYIFLLEDDSHLVYFQPTFHRFITGTQFIQYIFSKG